MSVLTLLATCPVCGLGIFADDKQWADMPEGSKVFCHQTKECLGVVIKATSATTTSFTWWDSTEVSA